MDLLNLRLMCPLALAMTDGLTIGDAIAMAPILPPTREAAEDWPPIYATSESVAELFPAAPHD